jgi:hypothetical protein
MISRPLLDSFQGRAQRFASILHLADQCHRYHQVHQIKEGGVSAIELGPATGLERHLSSYCHKKQLFRGFE